MTSVAERLKASRRIDWKYLLGEPLLRDVAVLEPVGHDLRTALEVFADRFQPVPSDDTEFRHPDGTPSRLVVVPDATRRRMERARALVAPGGWLYAEFGARSPSLLRNPAHLVHDFDSVRTYWVHSTHDSPRAFVELTTPGAARAYTARHLGGTARHLVGWLIRSAAVRRSLGPVALVARRPDPDRGTASGDPAICQPPTTGDDRDDDGGADDEKSGVIVLTPSFSASRHVIGLIVNERTGALLRVVKTSRLADDTQLEAEARALTAVEELAHPPLRPRVLSWGPAPGGRRLVQTPVAGDPMDRRAVASDPDGCTDLMAEWLSGLDRPGRSRPVDDGRWARLVEEPLRQLELRLDPDDPVRGLIEPTRTVVGDLAHHEIPVSFEHGDTRHPNILMGPDGVGLVDWELGQAEGFPLHDLSFFLEFVLESRGVERPAASLVDPGSWAGARLAAEARRRDLDPRLCGPLVLLALARRTADHHRRAGRVGPRPSASWRSCLEALGRGTSVQRVGVT